MTDSFCSLIVGADTKVRLEDGRYVKAINFDNAATTPPLRSVMDAVCCYAPWYSSVHRGKGHKSVYSSEVYEKAREMVKRFVGSDGDDVVVFTKNTTESINILAALLRQQGEQSVILSTEMEHLANDLPWRDGFTADFIGIGQSGQLMMGDLEAKLQHYGGSVKLVAVTGASNVTGYKNPVHTIAALAHQYGAKILVDGAQLIPHAPFAMRESTSPYHIDYLVFSAHKMYAPFGTGVLIGPKGDLSEGLPLLKGGGAVDLVSSQFVKWLDAPERLEAGTPNMMGVVALTSAMEQLAELGREELEYYETSLLNYAIDGLRSIPGVKLYSSRGGSEERVSLISFSVEGFYHSEVAEILAREAGIAVRSGLFCAHPYVEKLLHLSEKKLAYYYDHEEVSVPGLVRISFGIYNCLYEIDVFLTVLEKIIRKKDRYLQKYRRSGISQPCRGDRC